MSNNLNFFIIFVFVIIVLALFTKKAKSGKAEIENDLKIYRFTSYIRWLVPLFYIISGPIFIYAYFNDINKQPPVVHSAYDMINVFLIFGVSTLIGYYFKSTYVILSKTSLIKKSLFGYYEFDYDRISKIIIYYSSGNPAAGLSKVYCGKKNITIEVLFEGHDDLLNTLLDRCHNAIVIEKGA